MTNLKLDELQVRRIILVRAIEEADSQGKLLGKSEIEQLEQRAFQSARREGNIESAAALDERARLVLQSVAKRDPSVSALQHLSAWRRWFVFGVPLVSLILGIATDRIANPHRVDLLALPLLLILLWNVAVYVFLLMALLFRAGGRSSAPFAPLFNALESTVQRSHQFGRLNRDVARKYLMYRQDATASADDQRIRQVLHLSAAAWGVGVVLSLILRGVVVEYRTGWESTMLSAEQVHGILSVLFLPVMALFSLEPFTLQEITNMRFDTAESGEASHGRRWVFLYAGLLMIVVVMPRLLMGLLARWRVRHLSSRMTLDLGDPYFEDLIEKLCPANVRLYVHAHRPSDKAALESVLLHGQIKSGKAELVTSPYGDALSIVGYVPQGMPVHKPLWEKLRAPFGLRDTPPDDAIGFDVALHLVGDPADLEEARWLYQLRKPVLKLARAPGPPDDELLDRCRMHKGEHPDATIGVLPFRAFSGCWVQEPVLLNEIARLVPRSKSKGFLRLAAAWHARNTARFKMAMAELSAELVAAAAVKERVSGDPRTLWSLMSPAQRDLHKKATSDAVSSIAERLEQRATDTYVKLLKLHGVGHSSAARARSALEGQFDVNSGLNASQAAMGGAATGATVGASVDLMTGGLTLGAAALLGALVGGSGAALAAAWKNRFSESGVTTVQLPDELLEIITVERLLGYLQVVHLDEAAVGEGKVDLPPYWKTYVLAATNGRRAELASIWASVRGAPDPIGPAQQLAQELEAIMSGVLFKLYPNSQDAGH